MQHIIVDGILVAVFIFQVERTTAATGPSAELVGFQKRRATPATSSRPPSQSFPSPSVAPPFSSNAAHSPAGYLTTTSPAYLYSTVPQQQQHQPVPGLSQPTAGEMVGPSTSSHLDAGLLGTTSPGRMYYPQP